MKRWLLAFDFYFFLDILAYSKRGFFTSIAHSGGVLNVDLTNILHRHFRACKLQEYRPSAYSINIKLPNLSSATQTSLSP